MNKDHILTGSYVAFILMLEGALRFFPLSLLLLLLLSIYVSKKKRDDVAQWDNAFVFVRIPSIDVVRANQIEIFLGFIITIPLCGPCYHSICSTAVNPLHNGGCS